MPLVEEGAVLYAGNIGMGITHGGGLILYLTEEADWVPSVNPNLPGLFFLPTGMEALGNAVLSEGWGVRDMNDPDEAHAVWANRWYVPDPPGAGGGTIERFTASDTEVTSVVVSSDGKFRVTHTFHGSPFSENLVEINVLIENTSGGAVKARYRRSGDWDIFPTETNDLTTFTGFGHPDLRYCSNDGFARSIPGIPTDLGEENKNWDHTSREDDGFLFEVGDFVLAAGGSKVLTLHYGAAATRAEAEEAIGVTGSPIYSLGMPDPEQTELPIGEPTTFFITCLPGPPTYVPPVIAVPFSRSRPWSAVLGA